MNPPPPAARAAEYSAPVLAAQQPRVMRQRSRRRSRRQRRLRLRHYALLLAIAGGGALLSLLALAALTVLLLRPQNAPTDSLAMEPVESPAAITPLALPTPVLAARVVPAGDNGDASGDASAALPPPLIALEDGREIALKAWDGQSRFTMLIAGMDRRPDESGLAFRTDTMMLLSIDPLNERIGLLSLPRDLYVRIPDYEEQRLNAALFFGETQWRGYGPTLLIRTLQDNLGMAVHAYAILDFRAFIALVDAVGGIDIVLEEAIDDPHYPDLRRGYDPFYLAAGAHHLDGEQALKFARTRHGGSDMQRAARQQQALLALRERVLRLRQLPLLLARAPALLAELRDSLYTNLDIEDMISLAWYLKDFPLENMQRAVLRAPYVSDWVRPEDGQHVLVADQWLLASLLREVFGADYAGW